MKTKSIILLVAVIFGLGFTQCKKDKGEPPALPPSGAMSADFSIFNETKAVQDSFSIVNWQWAAWNVGFWNVAIYVNLAVPVAAFAESFKHTPVQEDDESWTWEYTVTTLGGTYTCALNGKTVTDGVEWKMYISSNTYTDFLWYEGYSNLGNTYGTWTLYRSPSNPEQYIGITWNSNISAGTSDIEFKNIVPGGDENGGYIKFGIVSGNYDAFYHIYNKGADNLTEIEADRTTQEGRIKDEAHFGNTDWYCWDNNHYNVDCQ
ncbi:MAG: hypothetical protein KJ607_09495 [Bacteroidetes bacterium]|nr:hypothetical protein [Bacteroidota bacterium]